MNETSSKIDAALAAVARAAFPALIEAARLGGEIALRDFRQGARTAAKISYKQGDSPVTTADIAVDTFLKARLCAAFPDAAWLSEETIDDPARLGRELLLIVDPIDGTRGYMNGDPRWTVCIALAFAGRPIAGVVHAPALEETFAAALGAGATLNGAPIRASAFETVEGIKVVGPRTLVSEFASALQVSIAAEAKVPSLAYRLALAASGKVDIALASNDSYDWDIAAADLILSEAGAGLHDPSGREVSYNRPLPRHDPLIAAPRKWLPQLVPAFARALGRPGRRET